LLSHFQRPRPEISKQLDFPFWKSAYAYFIHSLSSLDLMSKNKAAHFDKKYWSTHLDIFCKKKVFPPVIWFWSLYYTKVQKVGYRLGNTVVKKLLCIGVEFCTKFGGDLCDSSSCMMVVWRFVHDWRTYKGTYM